MKNAALQELADTTAYWLTYESLTGIKAPLFNEASLTTPILEYLARVTSYELLREEPHPTLKNPARGRPIQIDFVAKRQGAGWAFVLETKFGRQNPDAIVNDVMRLAMIPATTAKRYLLVAGSSEATNSFSWKVSGLDGTSSIDFYGSILKLDDTPHFIDLRRIDARFGRKFAAFQRRYKLEDVPNMLNLPRVAHQRTALFEVAIWEVSLRKGSGRSDLKSVYRVKKADLDASLAADEAS